MPMDRDTRRIVRTTLVLLALVMMLLATGMIVITVRLKPIPGQPVDHVGPAIGIGAYLLIAAICFSAFWRLRPRSP